MRKIVYLLMVCLLLAPLGAIALESRSKVLDSKALDSISFASAPSTSASTPFILTPKEAQIFHTEGIITAISAFNDTLFVGNANGGVEVYTRAPDSESSSKQSSKSTTKPTSKPTANSALRQIHAFSFPPVTDYFNESFQPRIFDLSSDGKSLYVLKEGARGSKEIFKFPLALLGSLKSYEKAKISESPRTKPTNPLYTPLVVSHSAPKRIIAFRDKDAELLLIGFLGNTITLYDTQQKRDIFTTQISHASFSDLAINSPYVFSTDESGAVHVLSLDSGTPLAKLENINKDNNYQLASAHDTILTAGADRQMGIYTFNQTKLDQAKPLGFNLLYATSIRSEFLIYAVGISPSGELAAFSKNEQNDIAIINIKQKREVATLKSAQSSINALLFLDEHTLIVGSDERLFSLWHLPNFD